MHTVLVLGGHGFVGMRIAGALIAVACYGQMRRHA